MIDTLRFLGVTFFGAGLSPIAPGTVGSLAATAVAYGVFHYGQLSWWLLLVLALTASVINVATGEWIEERFAGKDPGACVIDECAGQWLTLVPLTLVDLDGVDVHPVVLFFVGFVLFRIFDILKPFGARRLEQLPLGWGVLMDDILCGVYAAGVLTALLFA